MALPGHVPPTLTGEREVTEPLVSVIIPTYNRCERLKDVIAALQKQTVAPASFEAVVVSDGSTDGTDAYLDAADVPFRMVTARQANAGPAAARNHGAGLASGDILLFLDDDVIAAPSLVEEHLRSHRCHHRSAVVIGPMLTPSGRRLPAVVRWEQAMLYKQYDAMRHGVYAATYRQFYTGNASLRRSFFVGAGGFDERVRRAEDVELAYRLAEDGAEFVFNENAIGYHCAERTFDAWLRNAYAYAASDVVFAAEGKPPDRLQVIRREFSSRNPLIRWIVRTAVARRSSNALVGMPLRMVAQAMDVARVEAATMAALSALYNVAYYTGLASQLGGRDAFLQFLAGATLSDERAR